MSDSEKEKERESFRKKFNRWDKRADRRLQRLVSRGTGYRFAKLARYAIIAYAVFFFGGLLIILLLGYAKAISSLDWNTVFAILIADFPISLFLWVLLERQESKTSELLANVEKWKIRAKFDHLEIRCSDKWGTAIYDYFDYYIVNTKTKNPQDKKLAYWVSEEIHDFVEAKLIKEYPRFDDREQLLRYFKAQNIEIEKSYPTANELGLENL